MDKSSGSDRHVRQLRNDVDDIYDILGNIQGTVDTLTVTVDGHTVTLAEHSTILAEHTHKLDHIIELLQAS